MKIIFQVKSLLCIFIGSLIIIYSFKEYGILLNLYYIKNDNINSGNFTVGDALALSKYSYYIRLFLLSGGVVALILSIVLSSLKKINWINVFTPFILLIMLAFLGFFRISNLSEFFSLFIGIFSFLPQKLMYLTGGTVLLLIGILILFKAAPTKKLNNDNSAG